MLETNPAADPCVQFLTNKLIEIKKWKTALQQFDDYEFGNHKDVITRSFVGCDVEAGKISIGAETSKSKSLFDDEKLVILFKIMRDSFEGLRRAYAGYISTTMQIHKVTATLEAAKSSDPNAEENCSLQRLKSNLESLEAERSIYRDCLLKNSGAERLSEIDKLRAQNSSP